PVAIAWSWAGPYLGINVGYSAGKSKTDAVFSDPTGAPLFTTGSTDNLNGVIAGFQGGYNWMASSWLMAGIEADIQLSTQNTTPTFICPGGDCIDPHGYDAGKKVKGKKRHILVDTLGLLLHAIIHPADREVYQKADGSLCQVGQLAVIDAVAS